MMRYIEDVVTLRFDADACTGCGRCIEVCPHAVFELVDKRAVVRDRNACMECGACASNCQYAAIEVRSGVGCAAGVLAGMVRGTEPTCDCAGPSSGCC